MDFKSKNADVHSGETCAVIPALALAGGGICVNLRNSEKLEKVLSRQGLMHNGEMEKPQMGRFTHAADRNLIWS